MQPALCFPTTCVVIENNLDNKELFQKKLEYSHQISSFPTLEKAEDFLSQYSPPLSHFSFLKSYDDNFLDLDYHCLADVNLTELLALKEIWVKSQEISVIIIDLSYMTQELLLETLNKLSVFREMPFKKILLMKKGYESQVISAFNDRLIDKFISKDSENFMDVLSSTIHHLTHDYFLEKTRIVLTHLELEEPVPLTDKIFSNFFTQWCFENNISEYYLMDKKGSFLCVDREGKTRYFITHTKKSLNYFYELCQEANIDPPAEIMTRQKVPFFGLKRYPWQYEHETWSQYFYPANLLEGREKYWWVAI